MGIQDGYKGRINMTNENHRAWVKQVFACKWKHRALYYEVCKHLDCDVLFDHPDKKHLARLLLWWAAISQIDMNDMLWMKPYMRYAKYNAWIPAEGYSQGIPYAKELAKRMNLRVHDSVRAAPPLTRTIKKSRKVTFSA